MQRYQTLIDVATWLNWYKEQRESEGGKKTF